MNSLSWILDALHTLQGKESGLHASHFSRVQTSRAFFDPAESRDVLGYQTGGLAEAWRETVAGCPEEPAKSHWQKFSERAQALLHRN